MLQSLQAKLEEELYRHYSIEKSEEYRRTIYTNFKRWNKWRRRKGKRK